MYFACCARVQQSRSPVIWLIEGSRSRSSSPSQFNYIEELQNRDQGVQIAQGSQTVSSYHSAEAEAADEVIIDAYLSQTMQSNVSNKSETMRDDDDAPVIANFWSEPGSLIVEPFQRLVVSRSPSPFTMTQVEYEQNENKRYEGTPVPYYIYTSPVSNVDSRFEVRTMDISRPARSRYEHTNSSSQVPQNEVPRNSSWIQNHRLTIPRGPIVSDNDEIMDDNNDSPPRTITWPSNEKGKQREETYEEGISDESKYSSAHGRDVSTYGPPKYQTNANPHSKSHGTRGQTRLSGDQKSRPGTPRIADERILNQQTPSTLARKLTKGDGPNQKPWEEVTRVLTGDYGTSDEEVYSPAREAANQLSPVLGKDEPRRRRERTTQHASRSKSPPE